jgi:hypothetical protein
MKAPQPFEALGTSCPMTCLQTPEHLIICIHLFMLLMLSFSLLCLYVIKIKQQRAMAYRLLELLAKYFKANETG